MKDSKIVNVLLIILALAFAAVFIYSAYMLYGYFSETGEAAEEFNDLSKLVEEAASVSTEAPVISDEDDAPVLDNTTTEPYQSRLPGYAALHEINPDLFGWIKIEGTVIDYPVMHTPDDPEYYLKRSFEGKKSSSGVPFMGGECFEGCLNYIIYGHHMKNGSMFAKITSYSKKNFWEEHKTIIFDTLNEEGEYTVFAAFYADAAKTDFEYHKYTDLTDEDVFNEYINKVLKSSKYDTGIVPVYGDELITLSTCSFHTDEGRFVVVAVKTAKK